MVRLKDLELLKTLMERQGVSARALAHAAGWKSHTSANRLLAGEVRKVKPEAANAIARHLKVHTSLLFAPEVLRNHQRNVA